MISTLATGYLFLGGSGAGTLLALSILEILRASRKKPFGIVFLPAEFFFRAWTFCLAFLALGGIFLLFDLGHADAVVYVILTPQLVALTVGAFSLMASIACAAVFFFLNAMDNVSVPRWASCVLAAFAIICSVSTMSYTGILLQSMASVLAWHTPLLPLLFALSSISCGIALLLISAVFTEANAPLLNLVSRLLRSDSAIIALEVVVLIAFTAWMVSDSQTALAAEAMVSGPISSLFWIGLVAIGLVLPFAMECIATLSSHRPQLIFIAIAVLVGGIVIRVCMVSLAQFDPSQALAAMQYNLQIAAIG